MAITPTHTTRGAMLPQLPRTTGLPLVGAFPQFISDPFGFLRGSQQRYGDIYTLDIGLLKWVILHHPRHAEHVLVSNAQNYSKAGPMWDTVRELLGNGLVVSEGDFWLRQRRMIQPHFHRQRLTGLTEAMVAATAECFDIWDAAAGAAPLDALQGFAPITMRVIARALFGQGLERDVLDRVHQQMAYVLHYMMLGTATRSLPRWVPIPGARRYRETIRALDTEVYQIIARERHAETPSDSMLSMLVHMVDEETGEGMTDTQLHDEVMTFFLAGYETTSLALTWTMFFLTQHPEMLERVRAEVDDALGGKAPTFADLPKLAYTKAVVQEVLRIRPASWWLPRTAVADDVIDGFHIPAGTTVVSFTYGIHHNPSVWEEPDRFNPERFLGAPAAQRHRLAWVPFGAGQRQCIGRDFSLMEAQIILAMLVQRYSFEAAPGSTGDAALSTTLKPKQSVKLMLKQR
jgi:cytochrome P450